MRLCSAINFVVAATCVVIGSGTAKDDPTPNYMDVGSKVPNEGVPQGPVLGFHPFLIVPVLGLRSYPGSC